MISSDQQFENNKRFYQDIHQDKLRRKLSFHRYFQTEGFYEFQSQLRRLQLGISGKKCVGDTVNPIGCDWYHSGWPILRTLNMVSTPDWHGNFYINAFSAYTLKHKRKLNILITGTADATILEHLDRSIGHLKNMVIWVVDLCQTPLDIARIYAKKRHFKVRTLRKDALCLVKEGLEPDFFDMITTDAFITRFQKISDKQKIVQEWYKVLKRGGRVVTTCRLSGQKKEKGSPEDIRNFVQNTLRIYDDYLISGKSVWKFINRELAQDKASQYAKNITSYPIEEVRLINIFKSAGFKLINKGSDGLFTKKLVGGEFKPTVYAQIIAEK